MAGAARHPRRRRIVPQCDSPAAPVAGHAANRYNFRQGARRRVMRQTFRGWAGALCLAVLLCIGAASGASHTAFAADPIFYVVQPGDTLYAIGLRYGVSWIDIMQANNLPG